MMRALLGLLFGLVATSAWSQNAVVGKQLYLNTNGSPLSCGAGTCHGPDPSTNTKNVKKGITATAILNAIANQQDMKFLANAPFTVSAQQAADIAAFIINPAAGNGAPAISLSGTSLAFGSTQIAATNATPTPATITLTNSGAAALTITGIAKAGTNAAEFTATGTCVGASVNVAAGGTCTIGATFTPTAAGNRTATFTLQSNAASESEHQPDRNGRGRRHARHFAQRDVDHVQYADGRHDERRTPGDHHQHQHCDCVDHCRRRDADTRVRRHWQLRRQPCRWRQLHDERHVHAVGRR